MCSTSTAMSMNTSDDTKALARRDAGARDFAFPPRDKFLPSYWTADGNEMFAVARIFVHPFAGAEVFYKLSVTLEGCPKVETIKYRCYVPSDILDRLTSQDFSVLSRDLKSNKMTFLTRFDNFNRLQNYDSYLQFREHYDKPWWRRIIKRDWPKPTLFDGMITVFGDLSLEWGIPDSTRIKKPPTNSIFVAMDQSDIDYYSISDYSGTLFPDNLNIYNRNLRSKVTLGPSSFSAVKESLNMDNEEPLLYRMAQFYDPFTKLVYFIGTFENQIVAGKPFTIMLSIDTNEMSVMLNNRLGDNGKIYDFKVHVDSPPIVDQMANCAVILSVSEPEILVLCLETFKNIRISLHDWVTKGFLDRWERDKRRICMTFLSNYTKLVFFPKYSRERHKEEIPDDETFMPTSTMVDWNMIKNQMVIPFLKKNSN